MLESFSILLYRWTQIKPYQWGNHDFLWKIFQGADNRMREKIRRWGVQNTCGRNVRDSDPGSKGWRTALQEHAAWHGLCCAMAHGIGYLLYLIVIGCTQWYWVLVVLNVTEYLWYSLVLGTSWYWVPYLIFVTDATDGVRVNFSWSV